MEVPVSVNRYCYDEEENGNLPPYTNLCITLHYNSFSLSVNVSLSPFIVSININRLVLGFQPDVYV